jgi:hypothetical protein
MVGRQAGRQCSHEGVFERIPNFKLVLIESGCAWLPGQRLDELWNRLKQET